MMAALVGRDRELAFAARCLDRAVAGEANVVVCVGEPGIGKTRLAEEVRRVAEQRGICSAWGRAASDPGAPPYWPWREVLTALPGTDSTGSGGRTVIVSPAGSEEPSFEARMDRFDAVRGRVAEATRDGPLLVVVDDLDAADEPSQLLAQYLARSLRTEPVLLLVTCRGTAGPVGLLAQEARVEQLELQGLTRAAAGHQISAILDRDPSADELETLLRATSGNPFFLAELARQLADGAELSHGVPRSILHAVDHRIAQLTPHCRQTLQAAAVIGASFTLPVLAAVTELPVSDALRILDEADRATLIAPDGAPGAFRFTHALIRDAIAAGLDPSHRLALHRRSAEVLERMHPVPDETVLFELAGHWARAAVDRDIPRAMRWIRRAGDEAMRRHAYEDAQRWFSTALTLGGTRLDDPAQADLLIAFAAAQVLAADLTGALHSCQQVIDIANRSGMAELAGRAALVAEPTFDHDLDSSIRALCEQALDIVGPNLAGFRAKVLARYAVVCDHLADLVAAEAAVEESIGLADRSGEASAIEAALVGHHMVRSGPDGLDERDANAQRMAELGLRTGSAGASLTAAEWRFDALSERGDLAGAARELEVIDRWAARLAGPVARWRALRCRAMLAQARGRFAEAHHHAAQLFIWATGIEVATALGVDTDVAFLRDRLDSARGHHIVNGRYAMAYFGPAELWLGIAATHLGLLHEAVADLELAVKACFACGAEGFRAEAQYHLASAQFQRSAPGDLGRARINTVEALRCANDLRMPPLRAASIALLARIDANPSVGLTRREREVATLVAAGLTNRAIAERLVLSERTAQNHVQHILDKLQVRNRSQIAVWAQENLPAE